jgi:Glycine zipper
MRRILALSLALAGAVSVSACETPQQQNALMGGALGAGTGALIGSAVSGGSAGGALAGAAIGAGTGAMIGSAATPPPYYGGPPPAYAGGPPPRRCAQWAYDYNGNRVCTAFY